MNDLDRGALAALRLLERAMLVTEDETEPRDHMEGIAAAIKEGGIGLAIRREMEFERTLNIPGRWWAWPSSGEFNVTRDYGRFPRSLALLAAPAATEAERE